MDFLLELLQIPMSYPIVSSLWLACVLMYVNGRRGADRIARVALAYLALGYLATWVPLQLAGGPPGFFGERAGDAGGWAFFEWLIVVCPSSVLLVLMLGLVDYVAKRGVRQA